MRIYLDDDSAAALLARLLRKAGHEVVLPSEIGASGAADAIHLIHAIQGDRVCLTKNHDDFLVLHDLIQHAKGHHPGICVVRQDNDPTRDMTPKGIVSALQKLEKAAVPTHNEFIVLNQWR